MPRWRRRLDVTYRRGSAVFEAPEDTLDPFADLGVRDRAIEPHEKIAGETARADAADFRVGQDLLDGPAQGVVAAQPANGKPRASGHGGVDRHHRARALCSFTKLRQVRGSVDDTCSKHRSAAQLACASARVRRRAGSAAL